MTAFRSSGTNLSTPSRSTRSCGEPTNAQGVSWSSLAALAGAWAMSRSRALLSLGSSQAAGLLGMSSRRFFGISPREWLAGAAVCLVLTVEAPQAYDHFRAWFPIPAPMSVGWSSERMMPNGHWRMERELTIRERCGMVVWRRWFRANNAEDIEIPAAASSTGSLSPISMGGRTEPGTYTDWWEYVPIPGIKGLRLTTVAFAQCPSGFEGIVDLYVTPFDWTGVSRVQDGR